MWLTSELEGASVGFGSCADNFVDACRDRRELVGRVSREEPSEPLARIVAHGREEERELVPRCAGGGRQLAAAHDDRFDVDGLDAAAARKLKTDRESGHIRVVAARRALKSSERQVARDHSGCGPLVVLRPLDVELEGKPRVGAAFSDDSIHDVPPEFR